MIIIIMRAHFLGVKLGETPRSFVHWGHQGSIYSTTHTRNTFPNFFTSIVTQHNEAIYCRVKYELLIRAHYSTAAEEIRQDPKTQREVTQGN